MCAQSDRYQLHFHAGAFYVYICRLHIASPDDRRARENNCKRGSIESAILRVSADYFFAIASYPMYRRSEAARTQPT